MQCYLKKCGRIVASEILETSFDKMAIELGKARFQDRADAGAFDSFEVWDKGRLVYTHQEARGTQEPDAMPG